MGNAQGVILYRCVMEIQARTWLAMTPPSFSARDKVVAEGNDCVKRLKVLLKMLDFVETPESYKPRRCWISRCCVWTIGLSSGRCCSGSSMNWNQSEPTQTDLECAKPHIALCVKRLERV